MKRTTLQRKTGLQADPDKTRAFVQRGRSSLGSPSGAPDWSAHRGLPRQAKARETKTKAGGARLFPEVHFRARRPARAHVCAGCGGRAATWHHTLPQNALRRHVRSLRLPDYEQAKTTLCGLLRDERGLLACCATCHLNHEAGAARFTRDLLPRGVWEFCAELDAADGSEWATVLVERAHPLRGEVRP